MDNPLTIAGFVLLCVGSSGIADDRVGLANLPPAPAANAPAKTAGNDVAKRSVLNRPLCSVRASILTTPGELPISHPASEPNIPDEMFSVGQNRPWICTNYEWEAPATRHLPLLFEEPNLERLGYAHGFCDAGLCDEAPNRGERLQTLVSAVNFVGRIPLVPWMAATQSLAEPVYTLGSERPGSPVLYRKYIQLP